MSERSLSDWARGQWDALRATMSRFAMALVVILYIILIGAFAIFGMPAKREQSQVLATRYLGANTRMAKGLWAEPDGSSWARRIGLDRLEEELSGQYVKQAVEAGKPVAPENVASWPNMPNEDIVPVPLEAEPDWMTLNEGSLVEVWVGDKLATRQPALVEAIVGAGAQWTALVRRSDFAADALKNWADKPKLRLIRLPCKPQWSPT